MNIQLYYFPEGVSNKLSSLFVGQRFCFVLF